MLFKGIKFFLIKKPRGFNYKPRYSRQEQESDSRHNIHFRRMYNRTSTSKRSLVYLILLAIIVIYLIVYFNRISEKSGANFKVEDIKVEEVQE